LPWLYTWGSGRFSGVARDAQYLADYIVARKRASHDSQWSVVNEFLLGS
jgi:putative flavoprotein involved in K+ transport